MDSYVCFLVLLLFNSVRIEFIIKVAWNKILLTVVARFPPNFQQRSFQRFVSKADNDFTGHVVRYHINASFACLLLICAEILMPHVSQGLSESATDKIFPSPHFPSPPYHPPLPSLRSRCPKSSRGAGMCGEWCVGANVRANVSDDHVFTDIKCLNHSTGKTSSHQQRN